MASGPDHYREAEALVDKAEQILRFGWDEDPAPVLGAAQVHATLALAAATALTHDQPTYDDATAREGSGWLEAAG